MKFNIFKQIKNYLLEAKKKKQEKNRQYRYKQINENFCILDFSGKIYIICNDVAVYEASENESTTDLLNKIEQMRQVAYKYDSLKQQF